MLKNTRIEKKNDIVAMLPMNELLKKAKEKSFFFTSFYQRQQVKNVYYSNNLQKRDRERDFSEAERNRND